MVIASNRGREVFTQHFVAGYFFSFQLPPAPFRNGAVSFSCGCMAYADKDFRPVDKLPLRALERRLRLLTQAELARRLATSKPVLIFNQLILKKSPHIFYVAGTLHRRYAV